MEKVMPKSAAPTHLEDREITELSELVDYLMNEIVDYEMHIDMPPKLLTPMRRFHDLRHSEMYVSVTDTLLRGFLNAVTQWLSEPGLCAHCRGIVAGVIASILNTMVMDGEEIGFKRFVERLAEAIDAEGWLEVRESRSGTELRSTPDFAESRCVEIRVLVSIG